MAAGLILIPPEAMVDVAVAADTLQAQTACSLSNLATLGCMATVSMEGQASATLVDMVEVVAAALEVTA